MEKMKFLAILLIGFGAASAVAQTNRGGGRGPVSGGAGNPGRVGAMLPRAMENDWNKALEFFKEHSPLRAAAYEQMSDEQKRFYNATIVERYRSFQLAENEDLRKCLTRQLEIEDTVFDLKKRIDGLPANSPEYTQAKETLHNAVTELVEVRFLERSLRIARMGQLLAEERNQLEKDESNKEKLIDQRFEEILKTNRADPSLAGRGGREPMSDSPGRGPRGRAGE
jgi:hypothetical protein